MKGKAIAILLVVLGLMAGSTMAQTVFSVGANYWRAALEYDQAELGDISIDPGNLIGPYLNIRSGKLVIGGSMSLGNFKMNYGDTFGDMFGMDVTVDAKVKRTDLNFSVGYSLSRNLTLFGAYKDQKYKFEGSISYEDPWTGETETEDFSDEMPEQKGSFVGGGLSLVLPFSSSPLFAFGSAAYLAANGDDWGDITTVTFGLGLATSSNISLMVGYRMDSMGNDEKDKEKIKGVTATVAYTIR